MLHSMQHDFNVGVAVAMPGAIITYLSLPRWDNMKKMPNLTREGAAAAGISPERAKGGYVQLMEWPTLQEIYHAQRQLRDWHYTVTLPHLNKGQRILAMDLLDRYEQTVVRTKNTVFSLAHQLAAEWDGAVAQQAKDLGPDFNPTWYPAASEIPDLFAVTCRYQPLTVNEEDVPDAIRNNQTVRDAMVREARDAVAQGVDKVWADIIKLLDKLGGTLANPKGRIHDNTVNQLRGIVDCMGALNLRNDPALDAMAQHLKEKLVLDPKLLRTTPQEQRTLMADAAKMAKVKAKAALDGKAVDIKTEAPVQPTSAANVPSEADMAGYSF